MLILEILLVAANLKSVKNHMRSRIRLLTVSKLWSKGDTKMRLPENSIKENLTQKSQHICFGISVTSRITYSFPISQ